MKTITTHVPTGWGEDNLSAFIDQARDNVFASFVKIHPHYDKLLTVDAAYLLIGENPLNPPDFFAPLFLLKAHSSFRAAVGLAMSGQSPEAFMVMRGCLESALYGLYINRNEDAFGVWIRRHEDDKARKRVRKEFTIARMWETLKSIDAKLQGETEALYEKTIDLGAHPNPASVISALKMSKGEDRTKFQLAYLSAEPEVIRGTMKSAAQTGVIGLSIFRYVLKERYDILGLTAQLPVLRDGL